MKRTIIVIIIIVVVAVALFLLKPKPAAETISSSNAAAKTILTVNTYVAKGSVLVNKFYTNGNILANEFVDIKNEVPGRIVKILFTEGKAVKKGDLLVKLNDDDLQAQLKKFLSSEKTSETEISREKQLLEVNGVSQQDYDNAVNTINGIKADIENLRAQIEKTEIRAPFEGVIGLRSISVGSFLAAGTYITTLQQLNPVKIDFSIPEKYMSGLAKDATIKFTVDGVRDTFIAKTYAGEPIVNSATGTVQLRATCSNPGGKLIPGAYAHIIVDMQTINDAILVPSQALVAKQNSLSVFVIDKGQALSKPVVTGQRNDSTIQIVQGLAVGDTVITSAIMAMKNGLKVYSAQNKMNK